MVTLLRQNSLTAQEIKNQQAVSLKTDREDNALGEKFKVIEIIDQL